jgi:hypothetical protein
MIIPHNFVHVYLVSLMMELKIVFVPNASILAKRARMTLFVTHVILFFIENLMII